MNELSMSTQRLLDLYQLNESYNYIKKILKIKNKHPKLKKYIRELFKLTETEINDYLLCLLCIF